VEQQTLAAPERPVLDEDTFQQLLAAAYVVQEEREAAAKAPVPVARGTVPAPREAAFSEALSQIVHLQELLRSRECDLSAAANLVANGLQKITRAAGVAIALVREGQLEYCAALGNTSELAGARVPMGSDLTTSGSDVPSPAESLLLNQPLQHNGIYSVPLQHGGKVAGVVEVRFEHDGCIQEEQIRACQLMAGLLNEALARAAEIEWKNAVAAERATMLQALERIKPQLERLAIDPPEMPSSMIPPDAVASEPVPDPQPSPEAVPDHPAGVAVPEPCRQCGHPLSVGEVFCGQCGTRHSAEDSASGDLQSKWASMWRMQQTAQGSTMQPDIHHEGDDTSHGFVPAGNDAFPALNPEIVSALEEEIQRLAAEDEDKSQEVPHVNLSLPPVSEIPGITDQSAAVPVSTPPAVAKVPWASASKTLRWLQDLERDLAGRTWLTKHRADVYVGASVMLLLLVLFTGWSSAPQGGKSAQPSLTLFQKLLIAMDLAEPPAQPVYLGNPNTQVWVDLHTALYYCPGADLYGKTPDGKYTTQRDAQMDQFEPAARKSCD